MADDLPLPPGAYRIGNGVAGPVPIHKTEPGYSPEARLAGLEGTAIVTGVIDDDGSQRDMRVTRPLGAGLDRKALEAVARWRFKPGTYWDRPISVFASFAIDFRLPAKQSRWHLTQAEFTPEEGASHPVFTSAFYPAGAGIGPDAVEEGRVIGAVGRVANATVLFDIDERGVPIHFQVRNSSADVWGPEAIRVVRAWRFQPEVKEGKPVSTPAAFTLEWGPRTLLASAEAAMPYVGRPSADRGMSVTHPPVVVQTPPEYPLEAVIDQVQGTVVLALVVDEEGRARDLRVVESLGHGLDEAAVTAVAGWKFRPVLLNGRAEAVPATVRVDFHLPETPRPRR
jgi:TonB family protein